MVPRREPQTIVPDSPFEPNVPTLGTTDRPVFMTLPPGDSGRSLVVDQTSTVVVRAPRMPALAGRYLYGDYGGGKIEAAAVDKGRVVASDDLGLVVPELSIFGVGGSGRIYGCRSRARSTVWIPSRPMSQRRARERSSAIQAATRSPIQIGVRST